MALGEDRGTVTPTSLQIWRMVSDGTEGTEVAAGG